MSSNIFITGTGTSVGKTLISAIIASAASLQGLNIGYFKPIQTGNEQDCDIVKNLSGFVITFFTVKHSCLSICTFINSLFILSIPLQLIRL